MTPQRIWQGHPTAVSYFKVALTVMPLILLTILINNARQDDLKRQSDAQVKAAYFKALAATEAKFTYAINRSACSAYSLVDPTIKSDRILLVALDRAIKDPKTSAAMLKIDQERKLSTERALTAFESFRSVYGTIPPNFNCKSLPKEPPK